MENEVMTFDFFGEETRLVLIDGDPWFVATDVAKILDYGDATHLTRMLDEDEKGLHNVETLGGKQAASIISLPGLFKAVMNSRKEDAKKYSRWVTHEVLPAIHKSGGYLTAEKRKEIEDELRERMRSGAGRTAEEICGDVIVGILDKIDSMGETANAAGITCDVSALAAVLLNRNAPAKAPVPVPPPQTTAGVTVAGLSRDRLEEAAAFCDRFCDVTGKPMSAVKLTDLYFAYKRQAKRRVMKRRQLSDAILVLYDTVQFSAVTPRGEKVFCLRGLSLKNEWWKVL